MRTTNDSFNVHESVRREVMKDICVLLDQGNTDSKEMDLLKMCLQKEALHKGEEGFSSSNLWYYSERVYPNRIESDKKEVDALESVNKDLIKKIEVLSTKPGMSREKLESSKSKSLYNRNCREIRWFEKNIEVMKQLIDILNEERNRRAKIKYDLEALDREICREAEEARKKMARRMKPTTKKRPPRREARNELRLNGFEELAKISRQKGQYAHQVQLKKQDLISKYGESVYETLRKGGVYVCDDGVKIEARKLGAVTRYFELS